jgi:hypothetical protein
MSKNRIFLYGTPHGTLQFFDFFLQIFERFFSPNFFWTFIVTIALILKIKFLGFRRKKKFEALFFKTFFRKSILDIFKNVHFKIFKKLLEKNASNFNLLHYALISENH